jgi:hypothetical protein
LKLLGSIAAVAAVAEREEENTQTEQQQKSTIAVYKRPAVLLQLLLLRARLFRLRMGIEMKKTKTRRPSWRRLASEERRGVRQLITLSGSKPATRARADPFLSFLAGDAIDSASGEGRVLLLLPLLRRRCGVIWFWDGVCVVGSGGGCRVI